VDPRESLRCYDFGPSTVIVGHIRQLESLGYFAKGSACEPGEEVILKPAVDEAIVFEEFFATSLRILPHPALTDILVKFHMQLHQLTPNAFTQFSMYFWAMISFGGKPSGDGFAKCYELHYQLKKVGGDEGDKYQQFGCIILHGRWGSGAKLTPAIKNKSSSGWMKAWFYYKVPRHLCERGGRLCTSYTCTYVAWSSGQIPPSTVLTMTRETLPLSRQPNLLEVMMSWRNS
jgi:hypothetical protein